MSVDRTSSASSCHMLLRSMKLSDGVLGRPDTDNERARIMQCMHLLARNVRPGRVCPCPAASQFLYIDQSQMMPSRIYHSDTRAAHWQHHVSRVHARPYCTRGTDPA